MKHIILLITLLITMSSYASDNTLDANQWEYLDNCKEEVLLQYGSESKELIKELLQECELEAKNLYIRL